MNWLGHEWGWAWPSNRRLMYNRASADAAGKPWSERKKYIWWDAGKKKWTGADVPDFVEGLDPAYRPAKGAEGIASIAGNTPFIMQSDARGWLYAPSGIVDGPLPSHYEPQESVIENPFYAQQCNPSRYQWRRKGNRYHGAWDDPRFPYVMTTYRLTEHHTAGGMSRWLSWLSELQPVLFCEVSPELAQARGLVNKGWATVTTARGDLECRVLVTRRLRPFKLGKRVVEQIGLPYHFGYLGRARGDVVNDLVSFVADPNVQIMESKALTADIRPGRRATGQRAATSVPLGGSADRATELHQRDLPHVGQKSSTPPILRAGLEKG